ncbi:MAG: hypothetical protein EB023_07600 [Flavobacteriia bacterium]|nr:hypothetical protein [Flavobacteriia bacterium]
MKLLVFISTLLGTLFTFSQSQWQVDLSQEKAGPRMGVWINGDYTVYVALDTLAKHFRSFEQSTTKSLQYYQNRDSSLENYLRATQQRYGKAARQLEQAANGFDLKTLNIYEGIENAKRNLEDFAILERYLKQRVEQGKAIVYFKGVQIYTLCYQSESNLKVGNLTVSEILNNGYTTKAFYDEPDNCLFFEYIHLGW